MAERIHFSPCRLIWYLRTCIWSKLLRTRSEGWDEHQSPRLQVRKPMGETAVASSASKVMPAYTVSGSLLLDSRQNRNCLLYVTNTVCYHYGWSDGFSLGNRSCPCSCFFSTARIEALQLSRNRQLTWELSCEAEIPLVNVFYFRKVCYLGGHVSGFSPDHVTTSSSSCQARHEHAEQNESKNTPACETRSESDQFFIVISDLLDDCMGDWVGPEGSDLTFNTIQY